jgi:type IV pilus assembly protein PilC
MEFRYTARTAAGAVVRGSVAAPDLEAALAGLRDRALFITALRRERPAATRTLRLPRRGITARSRAGFFRSFATLFRAGVPIRRALEVTIERAGDARLKAILRDVLLEIERGDSLSAAFSHRPADFSPLIAAMIAAGEAGGILDDVLERIATLIERDHATRSSVVAALAYPATVLSAALALVVFLVARIVPMFATLFASFRVDLPAPTRLLFALGDALGRPWPWIIFLGIAALVAAGLNAAFRTPNGRLILDRVRLRTPIVGSLIRKAIAARFARMLGTLIHSGVQLSRALDAVIPVTGSPVHAAALERVGIALREGETLAAPLRETGVFDPMLVALVGVGEETGMLDAMLTKGAEYFESDLAAAIETLGSILEPALIVLLGLIVGSIVYSIFMPLYSLIGSVSS